ncbi:MAG: DUF1552 domain-containing protein [Myxococcales bacterium]|nr:MAG: DUF1552 domain-containing protein [Myxococcales bacterium]
MPRFKLRRRELLRGAGAVAIALPWLEMMESERSARAASAAARRLVCVYTPGGTVLDNWRPTGTEQDFELGPILAPLASQRERVLVLDGVDMKSAVGEQNQSGIVALLTGTPQGPNGFASGPSIDQVLASRLSQGLRLPSLELAVRWGTGKSHGLVSPIDITAFADVPTFDPIMPRLDPAKVWQELFGAAPEGSAEAEWDRSILDALGERYTKLSRRLGAADRQRLERHLEAIREVEKNLASLQACRAPTLVDTSDYDPLSGLHHPSDTGADRDPMTDAAIPKVGKLMTDMLVLALACDITAVATLQWSDTEAKHTLPWLGLENHVHFYMNDGGYQPEALTKIFTWYAEQHAYLLEQLSQTPSTEGKSLLDESIVFFGSNLQHPATHAKTDMPFLLAGSGGGLRTGRYVKKEHQSHNDLLVSLLNLCGDPRATFGAPAYCTGAMTGLT